MTDLQAEFMRLFEEFKREAYEKGWHDAVAALTEKAAEMKAPPPKPHVLPTPKHVKVQGRPGKAQALVHDAIKEKPGMNGVEIVRHLTERGTPVVERTVRTCLRRLRLAHHVKRRDGRWYPINQEQQNAQNASGEVLQTPPR